MKWLKPTAAALLLLGLVSAGLPVFADSSNHTEVYIDGRKQESVLISHGSTMVRLISFNDPEWVNYSYEAETRTVIINNPSRNITIRLQPGVSEVNVNGMHAKLAVPAIINSGRTYVPFRFLSETLGGYVEYNDQTKHAIVRTPAGQDVYETLMNGTLVEARNAAVGLAEVFINKELKPQGEGFSQTFTFPKGEALRFMVEYKGLISYIEISSEGLAEVKWQKDTIPVNGTYREEGIKPPDFGESVYFVFDPMVPDFSKYGTIDSDGKKKELGQYNVTVEREKQGEIIEPVNGEQRTDGKSGPVTPGA
ncbi:copper amine oxidase N-terminal domain-containing protein [Paenibacillus sp. sptzw28]|uniref:copper amine oxidase N-terminal domain-containing protein n=1 Tax=Paenibacillus sp. sptzw28 TaxID=715179 RepID=UPI001C6F0260|nr:copper amine oxidase N-terminal domain-containing protein [Paenibacillus sp. sptzw28]QYR23616.1 copper amine oxidase N-terminal domain-containing protein [Paenibacillus sp. sptzw28]